MYLPGGEISISSMTPDDLRNLIQRGEGQFLEFKKTTPSKRKIAREIAAFANTKGGTILVGVDDHQNITGISAYYEEEYVLQKAAHDFCKPEVEISIELVHVGPLDVMVVRVPESKTKPIYNKSEKKRLVFIRQDDKSVLASDEMTEVLKKRHSDNGVTFEYGENERVLFRYLNEYGEVTVNKYAQLLNVTTYRASKILVNLTSAGVLKLHTRSEIDYYTFSNATR
jgi:predicted HTH transcriptional regulator